MGLFDLFNKDKIENENKSKPFYENKNSSEIKEWFSKTRPWHKFDPKIIDALITRYKDNPMFEVFVFTSMEKGLVKEYEDIGLKGVEPETACSIISGILFKHGTSAFSKMGNMFNSGNINEEKLLKYNRDAFDLLESSIITDPNQIGAYVQLASLKSMSGKDDEALDFVQQGLRVIKRIRDSDFPFHKSDIAEIHNVPQYLDQTEGVLLTMERELS